MNIFKFNKKVIVYKKYFYANPYKILINVFYAFIKGKIERMFFMKYILETKNLNKRYKNQEANKDVSILVPENSIYGLLGPNGAGKSTLLKMVTGMINKTSGEIIYKGKVWRRNDLLEMGALIEEAPIYENLTARENLKVRTLLYNLPESRIDEVLEIVQLTNTGKKKAGKFSMGMKQRLGIAIALLNNPKLLILDEPTNGLDPIGIGELRELIKTFPKKGITVILSSHILSEVEQIADYIGIMVNGRLWYQQEVQRNIDLEKLFLDIVRKAGNKND